MKGENARVVSIPFSSAPSGTSGFQIPVNVDEAIDITGFRFTITFDPGVLQAKAAVPGCEGWQVQYNTDSSGVIKVAGVDLTCQGLREGKHTLVNLVFDVIGNLDESTLISITESELVNRQGELIPSVAENGEFIVGTGDINGDGEIDISDVILCLRMVVGLEVGIEGEPEPVYPPYPDWLIRRADINRDGVTDIRDVILILRRAVE